MPFPDEITKQINEYCLRDLPSDSWYLQEFDFILDNLLRTRIIQEFKNIRYMYKIFEGIQAEDELLLAEVRTQILMYASIYEAILHYILFEEYYKEDKRVKNLLKQEVCKPYSIPEVSRKKLSKELVHDGKEIVPYFKTTQKRDISKIRFDEKCRVASEIGLIHAFPMKAGGLRFDSQSSGDVNFVAELIAIYEMRNAIHLQAELKKQIQYHLQASKIAYGRLRPYVEQIKEKLRLDGKY